MLLTPATLLLVLVSGLLVHLVHRHLVQPLLSASSPSCTSPSDPKSDPSGPPLSLSHIPAAHPTAPFSSLWINYVRWAGREVRTLHSAHARLGPVVRLAPRQLSVNCVDGGLRRIYAGGWEKSTWYEFFSNYDGVPTMFATAASKPHSTRKRMLSAVYSKSAIQSSAGLRAATAAIIHSRLLPLLSSMTANGTSIAPPSTTGKATAADDRQPGTSAPTNIYAILCALTMDFVTAHLFGLSSGSNFTEDARGREAFLHWFNCRRQYSFWPQEFPGLTERLRSWFGLRLVPAFVDKANADIEALTWSMCEKAAAVLEGGEVEAMMRERPEDYPTVYAQLSAALAKEEAKKAAPLSAAQQRTAVASELLDHLAAGFDTSGITLTYLVHELSQRPALQRALRAELRGLDPAPTAASAPALPEAKAVDGLPLLHAVVMETLRLHAAIPGPQPRTSPAGASLGPGGHEFARLPAGLRVSSQAWSLHRNEAVFARAGEWRPERWLDATGARLTAESAGFGEMMRWFWAFGSGGRMCVGSHLAIYQMKAIAAAVYAGHETRVAADGGMAQADAYTAPPAGAEPLVVRVVRAA